VYVETFEAAAGPVVVEQLVIPVIPVIAQIPAAVGAIAPVGPATVAVKVIVLPKAAEVAFADTARVGVVLLTEVV
jgi:hypothetical protein